MHPAKSPSDVYRTRVIADTGTRVRVARPGETDAQIEKWRQKIATGGHVSLVFPTQHLLATFLARRRECRKILNRAFKLHGVK